MDKPWLPFLFNHAIHYHRFARRSFSAGGPSPFSANGQRPTAIVSYFPHPHFKNSGIALAQVSTSCRPPSISR
jgi:hypothetical protein